MPGRRLILAATQAQARDACASVGWHHDIHFINRPDQLCGLRDEVVYLVPGWYRTWSEVDRIDLYHLLKAQNIKEEPMPTHLGVLLAGIKAHFASGEKTYKLTAAQFYELSDQAIKHEQDSDTLKRLFNIFREREALGRKKYGTDVDRGDLRRDEWRQHFYEELLDAVLYSTRERSS